MEEIFKEEMEMLSANRLCTGEVKGMGQEEEELC